MRLFLLIFLTTTISLPAEPKFTLEEARHRILSPRIIEASGLAVSPTNPDFLWVINDRSNTNELHLTDPEGNDHGSIAIAGAKNRDWEDLSSFSLNGIPYLLIADTGDNSSRRKSVFLHIVREPQLPAAEHSLKGKTKAAWSLEFNLEGGPRDCEAVAVDAKAGKVLLLSKRTDPPELYELSLRPKTGGVQIAKKIGALRTIAPGLRLIPFGNQPTGMDISQDGTLVAITTYSGVFLLSREPTRSWSETIARKPQWIGTHRLPQAETIAISKDKTRIYLTSEGKHQPLITFSKIQ